MRHLLSILLFISCSLQAISQNTGIGVGTTNPHSSAAFEVMDSARGFLPPRMTYSQRNTISNPAVGLIVFCTDCGTVGEMQYFNGYDWISMALAIGAAPLVITTYPFGSVSYYSAIGSGNVSYSNPITPFTSRGICWSTSPNPTVDSSSSTIVGYGAGTFYSWLRNLSPGTTYFARAYAVNSNGKVYGNQISFTTSPLTLANVVTADVTGITSNSAVSGGNVTDSGGVAVSSRGVCWSTSSNPTVSLTTKTVNGSGIGSYTSNITGLSPVTTYYLRAYAISSIGTSYGSEKTFTTPAPTIPVLTTTAVTSITNNLAVSGGNISSDGGSAITFRGVCWDTLVNPTTGDQKTTDGAGTGNYTSNMSGLVQGKTYFVRSYAINAIGTAYGNEISFIFDTTMTFVTIGSKVWLSKNLDIGTYKNGDPIPQVTDSIQWANLTTGAWCWHFNDSANYAIYGRKYNWYAVADPRGLCPAGWHVSSEADWTTLINHLGGPTVAGGALKSTTGDWLSPNVDATNITGFTGLPGGFRNAQGLFSAIGNTGQIWTSTESNNPWYFWLVHNGGWILQYDNFPKASGLAVRCVKD